MLQAYTKQHYSNIAFFTFSTFSLSVSCSATANAKSNAVPGPLLVIKFPVEITFIRRNYNIILTSLYWLLKINQTTTIVITFISDKQTNKRISGVGLAFKKQHPSAPIQQHVLLS